MQQQDLGLYSDKMTIMETNHTPKIKSGEEK